MITIGKPIDLATRGMLKSPLSKATRGHLDIIDDVVEEIKRASGGTNVPPPALPYIDKFKDLTKKEIKEALLKEEDEEIMIIIKIFLECQ